jgi:hypothetical protein
MRVRVQSEIAEGRARVRRIKTLLPIPETVPDKYDGNHPLKSKAKMFARVLCVVEWQLCAKIFGSRGERRDGEIPQIAGSVNHDNRPKKLVHKQYV